MSAEDRELIALESSIQLLSFPRLYLQHKELPYTPTDYIFTLSAPTGNKIQLQQCYSCGQNLPESAAKQFCRFCGHSCCAACLRKKRGFPKTKYMKDVCCKVCDRKLICH